MDGVKNIIKKLLIFFAVIFGIIVIVVGGLALKFNNEENNEKEVKELLYKYEQSNLEDEEIYKKLKSYDKEYFDNDGLEMLRCRNNHMKYIRYQLGVDEYDSSRKSNAIDKRWDIVIGNFISDYGWWILLFLVVAIFGAGNSSLASFSTGSRKKSYKSKETIKDDREIKEQKNREKEQRQEYESEVRVAHLYFPNKVDPKSAMSDHDKYIVKQRGVYICSINALSSSIKNESYEGLLEDIDYYLRKNKFSTNYTLTKY